MSSVIGSPLAAPTQDPARLRRIRWRARRGLLENDLVLERFLDSHLESLDENDIQGLDALLELSDNELLDLILDRGDRNKESLSPDAQRILGRIRAI